MQNISLTYRNLGTFFNGKLDPNNMLNSIMNIIRDKFEIYMMDTFNVTDWHCDESWLLNFSKGILSKKVSELSIEWINEQISNKARREIME